MKLTPDEFKRGIISWESEGPIQVRTRTAGPAGETTGWSDWLTDSAGSVVKSPAGPRRQLSIRSAGGGALVPPNQLRWEQEQGDEVVTRLFEGSLDGPPKFLKRVLGPGFFHRVVVSTPAFSWGDDVVLREPGLLVRFVEGRLIGEKVDPISQVEIDEGGQVSLTSTPMGEYEATGRFIEIIVSGASADDAESRAHAALGLVGLCLGDQAVGDLVFSEPYETKDGRQFGALRAGVTAKVPRYAQAQEKVLLESLLFQFLENGRAARARRIALAWYEKAVRSATPLDSFFAMLVALEALINAYAAEHGPVPEVLEREHTFAKIRDRVAEVLDAADVSRLSERFTQPSFGDRARFYTTAHGWNSEVYEEIRQLYNLRNQTVHGDPVIIGTDEVRRAREMCVKLLKAELPITEDLGWEHEPKILGLRVEYELVRSTSKNEETSC